MKHIKVATLVRWLVEKYGSSYGVVSATIFEILEHLQEMVGETGVWERYTSGEETTYVCSYCKCNENNATPYCPHCGLPMTIEEG